MFASLLNGPARGACEQAAAPRPEARQRLISEGDRPMLLDFGAARHTLQNRHAEAVSDVHARLRRARALRKNGDLGPWTDIYSIGAIDVCLHGGRAAAACGSAQRRRTRWWVSSFIGSVFSPILSHVIRALRVDPMKRPQTAFECRRGSARLSAAKRRSSSIGNIFAAIKLKRALGKCSSARDGTASRKTLNNSHAILCLSGQPDRRPQDE